MLNLVGIEVKEEGLSGGGDELTVDDGPDPEEWRRSGGGDEVSSDRQLEGVVVHNLL
jgi:hypothetical protein